MFPDLLPIEASAGAAPPAPRTTTPALFSPSERAERRFWEFFTAHIRNPNTRLAYEADAIVSHGLGRFNGTVRARSVFAALEVMRAEHVLERARVPEAGRCHAEADVLRKEARYDVHG